MAKDEIDLDDLNIDDLDLGDDDFSFEVDGETDDRNPIASVKRSFVEGAKISLKSPGTYAKLIERSLPSEYSSTFEEGEKLISEMSSLKDETLAKLAPEIKRAKGVGRAILGKVGGVLPKSLSEKLGNLLEEDYEYQEQSKDAMRQEVLAQELGSIFNAQEQKSSKKQEYRDAIGTKRYKNQIELTGGIYKGIGRLVGFNEQFMVKAQQKSLELSFKQLFTQQDILSAINEGNREILKSLSGIVKNTGLPDAIKLRTTEAFGRNLRDRAINSVQDKMLSENSLVGRIMANARDKVNDVVDNIQMASSMSEMFQGMSFGQVLGFGLADAAGDKATSFLGDKFKKMMGEERTKKLRNIGTFFDTAIKNQEGLANAEFLRDGEAQFDSEGNEKFSFKNFFKSQARDLLANRKNEFSVGNFMASGDDPVHLTRNTLRSWNEIIPGWLARIHQELGRIRTGDDNFPLWTFNLQRGIFTKNDSYKADISERIQRSLGGARNKEYVDEVVGSLDTENKLSDSARKALQRQMLINAIDKKGLHASDLMDEKSYHESIGKEQRAELIDFFKTNYKGFKDINWSTDGAMLDKLGNATNSYKELSEFIPDLLAEVELQIRVGNLPQLISLGVMTRKGNYYVVNYDYLIDLILNAAGGTGNENAQKTSEDHISTLRDRVDSADTSGVSPDGSDMGSASDAVRKAKAKERVESLKEQFKNSKLGKSLTRTFSKENVQKQAEEALESIKASPRYNEAKQYLEDLVEDAKRNHPEAAQKLANFTKEISSYKQKLSGLTKEDVKNYGSEKLKSFRSFFTRDNLSQQKEIMLSKMEEAYKRISEIKSEDVKNKALEAFNEVKQSLLDNHPEAVDKAREYVDTMDGWFKRSKDEAARLFAAGKGNASEFFKTHREGFGQWNKPESASSDSVEQERYQKEAEIHSKYQEDVIQRLDALVQGQADASALLAAIAQGGLGGDTKQIVTTSDNAGRRFGLRYGIRSGLGWIFKGFSGLVAGTASMYGGLARGVGSLAVGAGALIGGAGKRIGKMIGMEFPSDIYVKGSKTPVLYSRDLRKGNYLNKNTGKVIKKLEDIDGPVVHVDEPEVEVLTQEDFEKGLFDMKGKPVMGNIMRKIGSIYALSLSPIALLAKGAYKLTTGIAKIIVSEPDLMLGGTNKVILRASELKNGGYFNLGSTTPLKSFKDIAGDIVDSQGKVVVTITEIREKGLVDIFGRPYKTFTERLFGLGVSGMRLASKAVRTLASVTKRLYGGLIRKGTSLIGGASRFIKRGLGLDSNPDEVQIVTAQETNDILLNIYNLLDSRLPGKKVRGDVDGDGVREGSWQDIIKERKEAQQQKASQTQKNSSEKSGGGLMGLLSGLFGGKDKESGEEDGDTIIGGSVDMGGGDGEGKEGKGKKKPRGKLGRAWDGTKNIAGKGWNAIGGAKLATYLKNSSLGQAIGKMGIGALAGRGAAMAGRGAALTATGGALMAGGMAIGGIAGAAMMGVGAVIASPVLLAIGAAATVGYLGYKLYKHLNKSDNELTAARFLQYGVNFSDSDKASKVLELEEFVNDKVVIGKGNAKIEMDDDDVMEAAEIMGADDTEETLRDFGMWFQGRFKPIYLGYVSMVRSIDSGYTLEKADIKFNATQKMKVLNKCISLIEGTFSIINNPFGEGKDVIGSPTAAYEAINKIIASLKEKAEKEKEDDKKSFAEKHPFISNFLKFASNPVTASSMFLAKKWNEWRGKKEGKANALKEGLSGKDNISAAGIQDQLDKSKTVVSISGFLPGLKNNRDYTSLDFIRYRCYGLDNFISSKIRDLNDLETATSSRLRIDAGGKSYFAGSIESMVKDHGPIFGIDINNEEQVTTWSNWFKNRFLPVFIAYMGGIKATGGENEDIGSLLSRLSASERYELAVTLVGLKSIWGVDSSPWTDMAISTDKSGVEKNLAAMKKAVKDSVVMDRDNLDKPPKLLSIKSESNLKSVTNGVGNSEDSGLLSKAADKASSWFGGKPETDNPISVSSTPPPSSTPSNLPLKTTAEPESIGGGGSGGFAMPANGRISSKFGLRDHPTLGGKRPHGGIDIAAPTGTPVHAAYDGMVTRADYSNSYGNVVYIHHDNGYDTRYAHLSKFAEGIRPLVKVVKGQVIGYIGNTGISSGPHLHFEIRKGHGSNSIPIDPLQLVDKSQAADQIKKLEDEKKAIAKEATGEVEDVKDGIEGLDTIASTELSKKDPALAITAPVSSFPTLPMPASGNNVAGLGDGGNKPSKPLIAPIVNPLSSPTQPDESDKKAIQIREERAKRAQEVSQLQNEERTRNLQMGTDNHKLMQASVEIQISMNARLEQIHNTLLEINKKEFKIPSFGNEPKPANQQPVAAPQVRTQAPEVISMAKNRKPFR